MKTLKLSFVLLAFAAFVASCGGSDATDATVNEPTEAETTTTETTETASDATLTVDTDNSIINWEGSKLTGKTHDGTLMLSGGSITFANGALTGGEFTIDMTSMDNTDLKGTDGHAKLLGHLKSDDFFSVETYPTATFKITGVEPAEADNANYSVSGDLTIKGITKNITFPVAVDYAGDGAKVMANFAFDRSEFDVHYGSKSKFTDLAADKVINDDIELKIALVANQAAM